VLSLGSLGDGVRYAFTSRRDGYSAAPFDALNLSPDVGDDPVAVERNRDAVLRRLALAHAVWLRAQHGRDVGVVSVAGGNPEVDALVTTTPGLAVAALSADCALVVLADGAAGVVAVVHCGRPGLVAGTLASAVEVMRAEGGREIRAAVGPTICGSCYEVPDDMAAQVASVVPSALSTARTGNAGLDIRSGVVEQLGRAGVQVVRQVGGCTLEDPSCFSYRRDRLTGRMAALVWAT
jgi:polyphenol oxidase